MASTGQRNSSLARLYLFLYNAAQCVGWTYIGVLMCLEYYNHKSFRSLYDKIEEPLKIFQTAAVLEVLHCAIGIVPSSVILTAFQVASRVFLVWGVAHSAPVVHSHICVAMFASAWTLTEIIRYSLYAFSIVGMTPYLLQWCRYTFFIILYPIGVSGELLAIHAALPYVKEKGLYSYPMPNVINFSFSYFYFLMIVMASYLPIFPQLYCHMLAQRRKIIGGKTKSA